MPETAGMRLVSTEIETLDRRLGLAMPGALRLRRRTSSCGQAELLAEQVARVAMAAMVASAERVAPALVVAGWPVVRVWPRTVERAVTPATAGLGSMRRP